MEWLVSFGGAYEPVGQGFESLPARHKKQYNFGYAVFYFARNLKGLEPTTLAEGEHNRDSRSERWAEPIESLPARQKKERRGSEALFLFNPKDWYVITL